MFEDTFENPQTEFNTTKDDKEEHVDSPDTAGGPSASADSPPKKDSQISQVEADTINRLISKRSVTEPLPSMEIDHAAPDVMDDELGGASPKTPDYVYNPESPEGMPSDNSPEFVSKSPGTPPPSITPPPTLEPAKSEDLDEPEPAIESEASTPMAKIWSGKLIFPEASTFKANAYVISGHVSSSAIRQSIPKAMHVAGRLDYKTIGEVSFVPSRHHN